ncbi:MAG: restriction endonuclease [Thiohalocapsa sp.]|nr:restriction endonuclease [Thiohalocapsa sp.]
MQHNLKGFGLGGVMAIWLVRAGSHGEYEKKYLSESRVYLTWEDLAVNLAEIKQKADLKVVLEHAYPDSSKPQISNYTGQIWAFAKAIDVGDWVILPSKFKPAIHVGEVKSDYVFVPGAEDPFHHYRDVTWIAQDIPRTNFDQDILYSLGAFLTVCRIKRNDAEKRIRAMAKADWKAVPAPSSNMSDTEEQADVGDGLEDLVQAARDQIAKLVISRFKGHGLERLVDAVLRAQGYTTYLSPEGPDKGIDILAAPSPMGFGEPRVCVQVKSGDSPLDRPTLDQLIGVMQNVQASHGLLVSWGGFKSSIDKEEATQFFRVRLWDQDDLIGQVLSVYDKLDEEIKTELPLKRIWVVAMPAD